jgi:hypothetical protein
MCSIAGDDLSWTNSTTAKLYTGIHTINELYNGFEDECLTHTVS